MYALETRDVVKGLRDRVRSVTKAVDGVSIGLTGRRVRRAGRAERFGQDDAAGDAGGPAAAHRGQLDDRRARSLDRMSEAQRTAFRRQKIGFTFQSNNLVPYLTALENVELMLRLNGRLDKPGKARARNLLERLGLGDRLEQPAPTAVGRSAAAGGDCPGADPRAGGGAGRRADREPRHGAGVPGRRNLRRR